MATIALYFLKVMLCSGLLFGYYYAALRNKKFHQYNRFYLLAAVVLSWLIPLIKIDLTALFRKEQSVSYLAYSIATQNTLIEINTRGFQFSWELFFDVLFVTVCLFFLIAFVFSILKIRRLLKEYSCKTYKDVVLVLANTAGTPFSFLRFIFWNEEIDIASAEGKQILEHELTHVREKHSYDKLFMQLNHVFGWWNIFFWLMNKELSMIHEFIADKKAIHNGDVSALAAMLLKSAYPNHQLNVTNPFFFSPIKRRLSMISNNSNPKFSYLRRVVILPLFALIALLFAFRMKDKNQQPSTQMISPIDNVLPLVVNASADSASTETMNRFFELFHSIAKEIKLGNGKTAVSIKDDKKINQELFNLYSEMSTVQQMRAGVKFYKFLPDKKEIPTTTQLEKWGNDKLYGLWIDEKRVDNKILNNYKAGDFSKYYESKLMPNAINYGKHYVQVNLYTNAYFEKTRRRDTSVGIFITKPLIAGSDTTIKPTITPIYITKIDSNSNTVVKKDTTIVIDPSVPRIGSKMNMSNALLVLDGKKIGKGEDATTIIRTMDPNSISSITVMKDHAAIDKYGGEGIDGVIEITTKKYADERPEIKALEKILQDSLVYENKKIFTQVEVPPSFPGGPQAWTSFMIHNLNLDVPEKNKAPKGKYTVKISFIVETDGSLRDVHALNDPGYGTKAEAERVITKSPKWKPAMQNGIAVATRHEIGITFMVN